MWFNCCRGCAGVCGGDAVEDCAGVCGGDAVVGGCDNTCGSAVFEECAGVCGGDAVVGGCDNTCGSTTVEDACGVCDGEELLASQTVDVLYDLDSDLYGFQFEVTGAELMGGTFDMCCCRISNYSRHRIRYGSCIFI